MRRYEFFNEAKGKEGMMFGILLARDRRFVCMHASPINSAAHRQDSKKPTTLQFHILRTILMAQYMRGRKSTWCVVCIILGSE